MNIILIELAVVVVVFIVLRLIRGKFRINRAGYSVCFDSYKDCGLRISLEDVHFLRKKEKNFRCMRVGNGNVCYSMVPLNKNDNTLLFCPICVPLLDILVEAGITIERTLTLGGGGGAVPLYILKRFQNAATDVVEINADSIRMMKKYFLTDYVSGATPRANLILNDAKDAVKSLDNTYQFIFCDLYVGGKPVDVIYDMEFMGKLSKLVRDNGMLLVQGGCLDISGVRVVTMILQQTFKHVWAIYIIRDGFVMIATNCALPALDYMMITNNDIIPLFPNTITDLAAS